METMSGNKNNFNKINKDKIGLTRLLKNDEEIQDMEYEEAIFHDKRSYLRMYWSFLLESQITITNLVKQLILKILSHIFQRHYIIINILIGLSSLIK